MHVDFVAEEITRLVGVLGEALTVTHFDATMDEPEQVIVDYGPRRLTYTEEESIARVTETECHWSGCVYDDLPGHVKWLVTGESE